MALQVYPNSTDPEFAMHMPEQASSYGRQSQSEGRKQLSLLVYEKQILENRIFKCNLF